MSHTHTQTSNHHQVKNIEFFPIFRINMIVLREEIKFQRIPREKNIIRNKFKCKYPFWNFFFGYQDPESNGNRESKKKNSCYFRLKSIYRKVFVFIYRFVVIIINLINILQQQQLYFSQNEKKTLH